MGGRRDVLPVPFFDVKNQLGDSQMKSFKTALLAGIATFAFASLAVAQSLTIGAGTTSAVSGGGAASNSGSTSGALLVGIAGGATSGTSQTIGNAAGQNTTGAGSNTSIAENGATSSSSTNTISGALGLAATTNTSNSGAISTGLGQSQGGYFVIKLAP
jgi:hypothetical protein